MNLNQAKVIAGFAPHESVAGRESLERAVKGCTKRAALFHPDRKPNDKSAAKKFAQIMAARAFFKKRIPHGCAVCGVTIGRGATHCQIHKAGSTLKALPAAGIQPEPQPRPKGNGNARVSVVGDPLALLGYYTAPVQQAVDKWREQIGEPMLQRYFKPVALAVVHRQPEMALPFVAPKHWGAVFDLGNAVVAAMGNLSIPGGWLLRLPGVHVATNGVFPSAEDIRQQIIREGGRPFTAATIRQALKKLQLTTPKEIAADWRKSVVIKKG